MATADQIFPSKPEKKKKPSLRERAVEAVKKWWEELRIGDGHVKAMGRLGFHELTQTLAAFPDSNVRPIEEPGVAGNPTPPIVTSEMGYNGLVDNYANRAQA